MSGTTVTNLGNAGKTHSFKEKVKSQNGNDRIYEAKYDRNKDGKIDFYTVKEGGTTVEYRDDNYDGVFEFNRKSEGAPNKNGFKEYTRITDGKNHTMSMSSLIIKGDKVSVYEMENYKGKQLITTKTCSINSTSPINLCSSDSKTLNLDDAKKHIRATGINIAQESINIQEEFPKEQTVRTLALASCFTKLFNLGQ